MYELVKVGSNSYYINCPAKIGLYVDHDGGVYLVDSGSDKKWDVKTILNQHRYIPTTPKRLYLVR